MNIHIILQQIKIGITEKGGKCDNVFFIMSSLF